MNRSEMRNLTRKFKGKRGLKKKHTKGSFGRLPEYIMDDRKKKALKKSQNIETKEVTKTDKPKVTEPIDNKKVTLKKIYDKGVVKKEDKNETDVAN